MRRAAAATGLCLRHECGEQSLAYDAAVECYCCGVESAPGMVASLMCHDEIKVCRICVGWLLERTGGIDVTPILPVSNMDEAIGFYESAGFDIERYDDGFAFVRLGDQSVFDLDLASTMDPSGNHAGCYVITPDADEWHRRFSSAGLSVTSIEDMPWGMHEFSITDPSGNTVRVGRNVAGTDEG